MKKILKNKKFLIIAGLAAAGTISIIYIRKKVKAKESDQKRGIGFIKPNLKSIVV